MKKIAVLSISLLTVMSGAAVAPALADIIAAFPDSPVTLGKMVLTTPALTIIPMALLTGVISRRFSRKKIIYAGLILYVAGGAGGGLADSIPFLLLMRAVLGLGVGVLMPVSTGIIADLYEGNEKVQTMGYAGAASNLGGIIATLLSGVLAAYCWRASFSVYLLGLPVMLLVLLFIPDNKNNESVSAAPLRFDDYTYFVLWGMAMFCVMAVFYAIPVNIALYLSKLSIGTSVMSGAAISTLTGSSFITGIFFGRLKRSMGSWLPVFGVFTFAAAFYLLAEYRSVYQVFAAMIAAGFSVGAMVPYIMTGVTSRGKEGSATTGTSVVSSFLFAGQFASPVIVGKAAVLMTGSGIPAAFRMLYICLTAFGIFYVLLQLFLKAVGKKKEE